MAPKGGSKASASKTKEPSAGGGGQGSKQKGAQSINVRHILCEKHAKKEEAVKKLNDGAKFDEVAREFSEDKARQGTRHSFYSGSFTCPDRHRRTKLFPDPCAHSRSKKQVGPVSDTSAGGSLGWKSRGSLLAEFEKVAFELEPSTTGSPKWAEVKTSEGIKNLLHGCIDIKADRIRTGYHLVMVEGRK